MSGNGSRLTKCLGVLGLLLLKALSAAAEVQQNPPQPSPTAATWQPQTVGLGGRMGGLAFGVGGSVRYWSQSRLGLQLDVSHFGAGASGYGVDVGYSTLQLAPAVLYRFGAEPDTDDSVSYRPYAGGGVSITRSSLGSSVSGYGAGVDFSESTSGTDIGFQGFGGVQITFKRLPKLAFSGDFGYYSSAEPFLGVKFGGFGVTMAAHYFVK